VKHYKLVAAETLLILNETVSQYLNNGYELWSHPYSTDYGGLRHYQAVVKR
jgi:hypothetical protein